MGRTRSVRATATLRVGGWVFALLLASSGCSDGHCDRSSLQAALDAASPGDSVRAGACTIDGPLVVPAGVTLEGEGSDTRIEGGGSAPAVTLETGGDVSTGVRALVVDSPGPAAVWLEGTGSASLGELTISVRMGFGVAGQEVGAVTLEDVAVAGTPLPGSDVPVPADPPTHPTHGVVVLGATAVEGRNLSVEGFATAAILARSDRGSLRDVSIGTTRGFGIRVVAGEWLLEDIRVSDIRGAPGLLGFAIAADGEAQLRTRRVEVTDGAGFGLFHEGAVGVHEDLRVVGLQQAAVWAQNGSALEVFGEGTELADNGLAAIVTVDAASVAVRDATLRDQRLAILPTGGAGGERLGDGVHVIRKGAEAVPTDVTLERVRLLDNARAGLLLDGADLPLGPLTLDATVDAEGEALGAVAQRVADLPEDWDADVNRQGATVANDVAALEGPPLVVADIIMPPALPPPDLLAR